MITFTRTYKKIRGLFIFLLGINQIFAIRLLGEPLSVLTFLSIFQLLHSTCKSLIGLKCVYYIIESLDGFILNILYSIHPADDNHLSFGCSTERQTSVCICRLRLLRFIQKPKKSRQIPKLKKKQNYK